MTKQDKMEELSRNYVTTIANNSGYFNLEGKDYGTDLHIRKAKKSKDRARWLITGRAIDIQLKAVHEKYISKTETTIKYILEVKNFNDLIERMNEDDYIPLILIVVILPDNEDKWIDVNSDELIIRKCAYWYSIGNDIQFSENKQKITIEIPKSNIVGLDFFPFIFEKYR